MKDPHSKYVIHRTTLGSVKKSTMKKLSRQFGHFFQVVDPGIIQSVFLQNWIAISDRSIICRTTPTPLFTHPDCPPPAHTAVSAPTQYFSTTATRPLHPRTRSFTPRSRGGARDYIDDGVEVILIVSRAPLFCVSG